MQQCLCLLKTRRSVIKPSPVPSPCVVPRLWLIHAWVPLPSGMGGVGAGKAGDRGIDDAVARQEQRLCSELTDRRNFQFQSDRPEARLDQSAFGGGPGGLTVESGACLEDRPFPYREACRITLCILPKAIV